MEQFQLGASYSSGGTWLNIPFVDLEGNKGYADVVFQTWKEGEWVSWNPDEDTGEIPKSCACLLLRLIYRQRRNPLPTGCPKLPERGAPDNKLDYASDSLEDGDHFAISYDNTASSNHSSDREGAYNGGSVILTLTGTVDYHATKVWQDAADSSNRPGVELQLWRYRADQDLSSAAPCGTKMAERTASPSKPAARKRRCRLLLQMRTVLLWTSQVRRRGLPLYLCGAGVCRGAGHSGYDQVFGEIDENGNVVEDSDVVLEQREDGTVTNTHTRAEGNTYLYNGVL